MEKFLQDNYENTMNLLDLRGDVRTIKDVALWIDGTLQNGMTQMEFNLKSNSKTSPNENALYAKINKDQKSDLFQSIHLGKVDLRQPKLGLNDWVITRIERLLDPRKGPVSEMNLMDVINPQDADFDLDKSASFYALPGKVIKEMYNTSGHVTLNEKYLILLLGKLL